MNKIINIVLSGLLWRQYKFLIISLILLILTIFIVGQIHDDYIAYASTSDESTNVGASFIVKWLAWILAFALFIVSNHLVNKRKEKLKAQTPSKSLKTILSFSSNKKTQKTEPIIKSTNSSRKAKTQQSADDPFAHLREKEKLRSFADVLIDNHDKK